MQIRIAVLLLLLMICAAGLLAQNQPPPVRPPSDQAEESIDSSDAGDSTTTATTTAATTTMAATPPHQSPVPGWIHLVRLTAVAGPVAFLLLAWLVGAIVHFRLVRREQQQFPLIRGTRTPQTMPMLISAVLFLMPVALFAFFEVRSRREISLGNGGVVDQWQPVTQQAWMTLVVCLVLAIMPWLFARRADTVG